MGTVSWEVKPGAVVWFGGRVTLVPRAPPATRFIAVVFCYFYYLDVVCG